MSNNQYENEVPKYRKQKESNISKAKAKSKHKHHYEECLIQYDIDFLKEKCIHTALGSYCTICGKIGDRFKEDKSIVKDYIRKVDSPFMNRKCYSRMSGEELYEEYNNKMPVFFVNDMYEDRYVNLEENEDMDG